jgi:hypothetical protein
MNVLKLLSFIIFTVSIISCDFIDDKLTLKNKSMNEFYLGLVYFQNEKDSLGEMLHYNEISKDTIQVLALLNRYWGSITDNATNKSYLKLILTNRNIVDSLHQDNLALHESEIIYNLKNQGNCIERNYTFENLDEKNWQITYPDDGFEKCTPSEVGQ